MPKPSHEARPEVTPRPKAALRRFVDALSARGGCGRPVLALELAEGAAAAAIEAAARAQAEAEVSEVEVHLEGGSARLSLRARVKGRVWPPRPPLDTRVALRVGEVRVLEGGRSGRLEFRVEEPLSFSSTLAGLAVALVASLWKDLPVPIDALRKAGDVVRIDFDALVRAARPDLADVASRVRLHAISLGEGRARLEISFNA